MGPVERVHIFLPVRNAVARDVVFCHVVVVVNIRRMAPELVADDLKTYGVIIKAGTLKLINLNSLDI